MSCDIDLHNVLFVQTVVARPLRDVGPDGKKQRRCRMLGLVVCKRPDGSGADGAVIRMTTEPFMKGDDDVRFFLLHVTKYA